MKTASVIKELITCDDIKTYFLSIIKFFFVIFLWVSAEALARRFSLKRCSSDRISFLKSYRLRPSTLLKKRLWYRCFPENFPKFLRTPFLTEHAQWLLLSLLIIAIFSEAVVRICCGKKVLKNFTKFTGKKIVPESLFNKVPGICNFIEKEIGHRCFPLSFVKCLRTPLI